MFGITELLEYERLSFLPYPHLSRILTGKRQQALKRREKKSSRGKRSGGRFVSLKKKKKANEQGPTGVS